MMKSSQFGGLTGIVIAPEGGETVQTTVVLLHGYGAPGSDLVGLSQQLRVSARTQFVFLQAPHTLDGMTGTHAARAWWHIDMMALQVARMSGQHDALALHEPDGLTEARDALDGALNVLVKSQGLSWDSIVVGGFSQGAMLSCDWALRSDKPISALVQLSGTVICEETWDPLLKKRSGLRVFQSHSPDDQVLPFALAERLQEKMSRASLNNEFVSFSGGHGISPLVLSKLSGFLSQD